jgi:two-component system chemotaxis response regulator CheB
MCETRAHWGTEDAVPKVVATHDIVVIGASAGGVEAVSHLLSQLPRDLKAAVFVVMHLARGRSMLPEILSRAGRLHAVHPQDGDSIEYGRVYVARPDHHLIIEPGKVRVVHGPTENGCRPAVDPLFRSAARVYGSRVIGIVLTGALDDGTAGLAAVKEAGGIAIVQDPDEAFAPSMPRSARAFVAVDYVLPVREMAMLITDLTRKETGSEPPKSGAHVEAMEPDLGQPPPVRHGGDRPGKVSIFTCPECHGTLWEADEDGIVRYRCRVGHVYSVESMLAAQTDSVDRALWTDHAGVIEKGNEMASQLLNIGKHHLPGKPLMLFVTDRGTLFTALRTLCEGENVPSVDVEITLRPRERRPRKLKLSGRRLQHDTRCVWFLLDTSQQAPIDIHE